MTGYKGFLVSKGVWGAIIALIGAAAGGLGYSVSDADLQGAVEAVSSIVTALGALLALYGRITATKQISGIGG